MAAQLSWCAGLTHWEVRDDVTLGPQGEAARGAVADARRRHVEAVAGGRAPLPAWSGPKQRRGAPPGPGFANFG
eukprot:scaffold7262_cov538-Prasinococcus_capsulatus_cf.AAC.1